MNPVRWLRNWGRIALAALAVGLVMSVVPLPASADQPLPSVQDQEVLIKTSLLTFNDANITGDYDVLHARLAKPFRDDHPADKLKDAFQSFADNGIFIDAIAAAKPVLTEPARIDERGALLLHGYFDVSETSRVSFMLDYIISESAWKLINITVKVGRPDAN